MGQDLDDDDDVNGEESDYYLLDSTEKKSAVYDHLVVYVVAARRYLKWDGHAFFIAEGETPEEASAFALKHSLSPPSYFESFLRRLSAAERAEGYQIQRFKSQTSFEYISNNKPQGNHEQNDTTAGNPAT